MSKLFWQQRSLTCKVLLWGVVVELGREGQVSEPRDTGTQKGEERHCEGTRRILWLGALDAQPCNCNTGGVGSRNTERQGVPDVPREPTDEAGLMRKFKK